jgi:serine/threonine-protein kinase
MKPVTAKTCPSCGERYDADVLFCPRDGTPLVNAKAPSFTNADGDRYLGIELAGQILIKHLIGVGSMGRVYRAFQAGIDRDVAVKILHRELSGNTELVTRFHREAKVASRLVHSNVVQVLMTGTVPNGDDPRVGGELYLVMEHLDGISLLSALAAAGAPGEGSALPLARVLHIAIQICDAVGEAHAQGIVHRDLKPENVMLIRRGDDPDFVKVLDFGIARLDWADRGMATQAGLIFGTAKYISPEGAEGMPVGPAADCYSIATILYQCLAGRTPFEGDSPVALLVQHTHAPAPDLRGIARASYVPGPIATVVMQNLAKRPAERSPNARALGRELLAAARMSGLAPEEIVAPSALMTPRGAGVVKLASNQRTKALDLSPELAARIGGIAAPADPPRPAPGPTWAHESAGQASSQTPSAGVRKPPRAAHDDSEAGETASTVPGEPRWLPAPDPVERTLNDGEEQAAAAADARAAAGQSSSPASRGGARASGARSSGAPTRRSSRAPDMTPAAELDFDDGERPMLSTIQGTETSLPSYTSWRPPRSRVVRAAALAACAVAVAIIVFLGGRRLGGFGASANGSGEMGSDSIPVELEAARECMRRHAWDAPARQNVKEITDAVLARSPRDSRVLDLRREAAERVVSDALGRKYAGDKDEALRLARLALEFHPALTTAQHLVSDLESGKPAVEPAPVESATDSRAAPKGQPVRKSKGDARAQPTSSAGAPPAAGSTSVPALPPPPAATDLAPLPAPTGTGPWL